ncbi:substrate-binding domain-containing protein [Brasilonema sp. UFV-L1]|uniref:substrate-binding domain-containing protein n=1 Tax=Brasilonema sp. UFV-L1 TaxID=2234130 RepID=UPI00145F2128|nr:substrate-binding domain-containing protein [Brasilonema sp. UFV-L1]NMG08372.1 phosphate ABC transporter substrate-binding protein [Brasilonema sp. UFV-L1]
MKLNTQWLIVILSASIIFGELYGCTTNTSTLVKNKEIANTQAQQEIIIGGQSSTYPTMKILADVYTAKVKNIPVSFVPPNQLKIAIAAVKEGLLDICSMSEELPSEENDGTLDYRVVTKDALLLATHPSVEGITNLTTANLKAIYSGAMKNWQQIGGPDAKIIVLDLPDNEPAKRLLRKYYQGKDLKNSPQAVILKDEKDIITALQNTPYSIGAFSSGYAISHHLAVNLLSLNGVEATPENVQSGRYQMVRTIRLVSKKTTSEAIEAFINFTNSKQAALALRKSAFVSSTY